MSAVSMSTSRVRNPLHPTSIVVSTEYYNEPTDYQKRCGHYKKFAKTNMIHNDKQGWMQCITCDAIFCQIRESTAPRVNLPTPCNHEFKSWCPSKIQGKFGWAFCNKCNALYTP